MDKAGHPLGHAAPRPVRVRTRVRQTHRRPAAIPAAPLPNLPPPGMPHSGSLLPPPALPSVRPSRHSVPAPCSAPSWTVRTLCAKRFLHRNTEVPCTQPSPTACPPLAHLSPQCSQSPPTASKHDSTRSAHPRHPVQRGGPPPRLPTLPAAATAPFRTLATTGGTPARGMHQPPKPLAPHGPKGAARSLRRSSLSAGTGATKRHAMPPPPAQKQRPSRGTRETARQWKPPYTGCGASCRTDVLNGRGGHGTTEANRPRTSSLRSCAASLPPPFSPPFQSLFPARSSPRRPH